MLGSFDNDGFDRNDLNKCPDCGCFFSQDACPLCGKVCPTEMRAGNRKAVKKRHEKGPTSTRIGYVEWYHRWWAIAIALLTFPLIGIILLFTSPHKTWQKALFVAIAVIYTIVFTFGGLGYILDLVRGEDTPVDTSLSREEYIAACEAVAPIDLYRSAEEFEGKFLSTSLVVVEKFTDPDGYYSDSEYSTYYVCKGSLEGEQFEMLVRDCRQEGRQNFIAGDIIQVYGEGAGNCEVYDMSYTLRSAPCINMAYAMLAKK